MDEDALNDMLSRITEGLRSVKTVAPIAVTVELSDLDSAKGWAKFEVITTWLTSE
jgi:hypothetical protein